MLDLCFHVFFKKWFLVTAEQHRGRFRHSNYFFRKLHSGPFYGNTRQLFSYQAKPFPLFFYNQSFIKLCDPLLRIMHGSPVQTNL